MQLEKTQKKLSPKRNEGIFQGKDEWNLSGYKTGRHLERIAVARHIVMLQKRAQPELLLGF